MSFFLTLFGHLFLFSICNFVSFDQHLPNSQILFLITQSLISSKDSSTIKLWEERDTDIGISKDEPRGHYIKWNIKGSQNQVLCAFLPVWNVKWIRDRKRTAHECLTTHSEPRFLSWSPHKQFDRQPWCLWVTILMSLYKRSSGFELQLHQLPDEEFQWENNLRGFELLLDFSVLIYVNMFIMRN